MTTHHRTTMNAPNELKNLLAAIDTQCLPEIQDQYFTVELCNAIDAARAAVGNPPASAWQPIETAPRDGTRLLTWDGEDMQLAWVKRDFSDPEWDKHLNFWVYTDEELTYYDYQPTHWQPLPSPPPITPP